MEKTLTLLVASTALTTAIGVPVWSVMPAPADGGFRIPGSLMKLQTPPLVFASDDDDHRWREGSRRGHDDEDNDARNPRPPPPSRRRRTRFSGTLPLRGSR